MDPGATQSTHIVRFEPFELDLRAAELRKHGLKIRLHEQPFQILVMLLDVPGEVVLREEIRKKLWPNDTIVEFDPSINAAIKKLREALSDSADEPRYVETVARRGYRFIGTLAPQGDEAAGLTPGSIISHYRILAEAGRGAMGVVYKAEDVNLGRMVALKFLPEELATHLPALERLRREARMIAALNHPGICTMYELDEASGRVFLAMEFLKGETLRQRMARKPLSQNELLDAAVQVARALEAAHGEGMVHRDIKPDNLFLSGQGIVKLMDFGLAKPVEEGGSAPQSSVTGTSGYMSPEQMRGEPLDARSDIYSLGKVLEQLAGKSLPRKLAPIIGRALAQEPAKRWQSARELREALEGARRKNQPSLALIAGIAATVVALIGLVAWIRVANQKEYFTPVTLVTLSGSDYDPSFSPDGNRLAYSYYSNVCSAPDNKCGIYLKQVGGGPPVRLTSGHGDRYPAWSPDDRNIAFIRGVGKDTAIMLIPAIGGAVREVAKLQACCLSWTPDSRWLVLTTRESPNEPFSIWRVSAETGERRRFLSPPLQKLPQNTDWVYGDIGGSLSPDGRMLVFARSISTWVFKLYAMRVSPDLQPVGPVEELTDQTSQQVPDISWASDREIIFSAGDSLFRMPVSGGIAPRRLPWSGAGAVEPAVSREKHRLVYVRATRNVNLWRRDLRTGEQRIIVGSSYLQQYPQYSPDGRKIAFNSDRSGTSALWTCEADGESCQQLTSFGGSIGGTPRWSPDGKWIVYDSRAEGKSNIYVIPADGGPPRRLTNGSADNLIASWSRDGRWIYFNSDRSGGLRVWKVPAAGGEPVQVTRSGGGAAFESVDGKFLYLVSNQGDDYSLLRISLGSGEEKQIAPRLAGWSSLSVTSKGAYFMTDPQTVKLFDESTGLVSTVAQLGEHSSSTGITVSADDAYLVFSDGEMRRDLMLVEGFR
jgi:Tol biopolymer transport system component/DNA-binding winged helix-turn-helix (wHTH) protein